MDMAILGMVRSRLEVLIPAVECSSINVTVKEGLVDAIKMFCKELRVQSSNEGCKEMQFAMTLLFDALSYTSIQAITPEMIREFDAIVAEISDQPPTMNGVVEISKRIREIGFNTFPEPKSA